jgi:hypothetical protein
MAKVYKSECSACSVEGVEFTQAEDGSFEVPDAAVQLLVQTHGFSTEAPAEPAEDPAPPAKKSKKG